MTPPPQSRLRLLVVDDDITIRSMLETALEPHYDVLSLPSGAEVLKTLEAHDPHLLLLDVNIAGDDGFEICERVRAQPRRERLPILFMTIRTGTATFLKSLASGGDACIQKPFEIRALRERIEYLISRSSPP